MEEIIQASKNKKNKVFVEKGVLDLDLREKINKLVDGPQWKQLTEQNGGIFDLINKEVRENYFF